MRNGFTGTLPNLFIPGAQKSGTTSLHALLTEHPEIYGGTTKEPQFFSRDDLYARGVGYYSKHFYPEAHGDRYVLDSSQSYMPMHEVPVRIRNTIGVGARFIFVFRHPVDRIVSTFHHTRHRPGGEVERTLMDVVPPQLDSVTLEDWIRFEQAAVQRLLRSGGLISRGPTWSAAGFPYNYAYVGCYSRHVQAYLDAFSIDNFLFLTFEDVATAQEDVASRISRFLDIDRDPLLSVDKVHMNEGSRHHRYRPAARYLRTAGSLARRAGAGHLAEAIERVGEHLFPAPRKERFPADVHARLTEIFLPEIERTEALTGLDLSAWKAQGTPEAG